jgi:hypothetical protein
MNKTRFYGYTFFGMHTLARLNVKLLDFQVSDLRAEFPNMLMTDVGKYGHRIEFCMLSSEVYDFKMRLANMLIDKKILDLNAKRIKAKSNLEFATEW